MKGEDEDVKKRFLELIGEYKENRANFVSNIVFDSKSDNLGKFLCKY